MAWINVADLVLLGLCCLLAFWGWRKGFLRMGFGIISFVAAILLGRLLYPIISQWLKATALYDTIYTHIAEKAATSTQPVSEGLLAAMMVQSETMAKAAIVPYLVQLIVDVLAFLLVVIVIKVLLMVISGVFKLFTNLPVIGFFNRMIGMLLGAIEGLVIASLLLAAVAVVSPLRENPAVSKQVEQSIVANTLYQYNPLLTWVKADFAETNATSAVEAENQGKAYGD